MLEEIQRKVLRGEPLSKEDYAYLRELSKYENDVYNVIQEMEKDPRIQEYKRLLEVLAGYKKVESAQDYVCAHMFVPYADRYRCVRCGRIVDTIRADQLLTDDQDYGYYVNAFQQITMNTDVNEDMSILRQLRAIQPRVIQKKIKKIIKES